MLNRREMVTASSATLLAASLRNAPLSMFLSGDTRDENLHLNPVAKSNLSSLSNYLALGQMLQNMRVTATSARAGDARFADVFTDQTGIDARASRFYDYDIRKVVGTQRPFASTVAPEEDFENIADWSINVGATVIHPLDPDPMVGEVAELNTGRVVGGQAVLRKYFGVIPATFGVSVLVGMATTLTSASEALEFQVQNNQGHLLKMRVYTDAVQVFYNGAWNTLFPYGGSTSTLTEWWLDAAHNGGSNYTIRLFAGTQELPGFTGELPRGTSGENGWVGFIQNSASVTNRKGRAAFLQVGSSALPADMSLVSVAQDVVTEPTTVTMAVMFEDVSLQTVINTDLKAWVSKDAGSTWYQVKLAKYYEYKGGVLDATKPVYLLAGQVSLPPSGTNKVCCRITSDNGRYFSLSGYAWRVDG
jgi:hypothetical protein